MLLRIYIYYLDKREFAAFEKERQQANWEQVSPKGQVTKKIALG